MRLATTILSTVFIFYCCTNEGGDMIPVEHITPTKDQQEVRAASEAVCFQHNIPLYSNKNALYYNPVSQTSVRSASEITNRIIALCFIELKSEWADKNMLDSVEKQCSAMGKLSPKEKRFILNAKPSHQEIVDANWRAEGMHVLLWALGYIDSLQYPDTVCSIADDDKIIFSKTVAQLMSNAKPRPALEILKQADLTLRFDWACTEARLKKAPPPGHLDADVVSERHYVFNWLIHYLNQDWDDITTGT